LLIILRQQDLN